MLRWILSTGAVPGEMNKRPAWFHCIINAGWLRAEDVLAKAEEVIKARDRRGATAPELLEIAIEAKREDMAVKIIAIMKAQALKDAGGVALLKLSEVLRDRHRVADAMAVLEVFTDEKLKSPKTSDEVRQRLPVKRVHLPIELAGATSGLDAAVQAAAAFLAKSPDDPAVWEGLSWAWHAFACEARDAGDHEEARRRYSFACLTARTGARKNRGAYDQAFKGCAAALKALKRDPKLAEDLKTPAGAARLAEELGPRWLAFPEAARKKMLK
jgi:hypothetical protein